LALAQEISFGEGVHLGYYLAGCAALVQKEFHEAERWLRNDVAFNRLQGPKSALAFSLTGLAFACYWCNKKAEAQQQLVESLQIAREVRNIRTPVHGLLVAVLLLAERGELEKAIELHALAMTFPFAANSRWCQDVVSCQVIPMTELLLTDISTAAQNRGKARDLWETVEEVLAIFGAPWAKPEGGFC
jgi:hypothetical protein